MFTQSNYPDRYAYPTVLEYDRKRVIGVYFPDLPGAISVGKNERDAIRMGTECLSLHLWGMEQDGDPIPAPSDPADVVLASNEKCVIVEVYMPPFREKMNAKQVKQHFTIPQWAYTLATERNIDIPALAQAAVLRELNALTA